MKNITKIVAPHYSGEFTLGTVTKEFVEYWSSKEEDDLLEYLHEVNWSEGFESASPTETGTKDRTPFHQIDDIEHFTMPYADSSFMYVNDNNEEVEFKPFVCNVRYQRGLIDYEPDNDDERNKNFVPVLAYATTEKGGETHKSYLLCSKQGSLAKALKTKNKHVNLRVGVSIQGLDLSKFT